MDNSAQRSKELGGFLKTRREKILPSQVGLADTSRRRTAGLRREEVALLAGIGLTWYTWLEQGRPIQVSAAVLDSLARVLMLNPRETAYVFELARVPLVKTPPPPTTINPVFQHVLDSLTYSPATILDRYWNVLAWNRATAVVIIDYQTIPVTNRNIIEIMLTNPEYQQLFDNWEAKAQKTLASFRADCADFINDPWLKNFIASLQAKSEHFKDWWSLHDVAQEHEIRKTLHHPIVGELVFEHTIFLTPENDLKMYINTPVAGTETQNKVEMLFLPNRLPL